MRTLHDILDCYDRWLWQPDFRLQPFWKRVLLATLRIGHAIARDINEGMPTLRAMSLVYTTLLSLVPLLAVSFSVLKGFGVHNQAEPILLNLLAPLGEKGVEITERVIQFVDNIKAGVLGSLGLGMLIYTVVALIQKIELTFNYTWHVSQHRSFTRRFSNYLSVVVIGPVLVFSSLGLTATMMSTTVMQQVVAIQPFGWLFGLLHQVIPYLLIICAFTFIYIFIPNTKVKLKSALVGAIVAGLLWELCGWIFASFIATSTNYTAIYSAFATLILFIFWLYLAWMILLIGASISFYHQHPEYQRYSEQHLQLNNVDRERLALVIMQIIACSYYHQQPGWSPLRLSQKLHLPNGVLTPIIEQLITSGFLITAKRDNLLLPAQPLEKISLYQIISAIRNSEHSPLGFEQHIDKTILLNHALSELEAAMEEKLSTTSLLDLALGDITGKNRPAENRPEDVT